MLHSKIGVIAYLRGMETPIYVNKGFLALDLTEYESLKQQIDYLEKDKKHLESQLLEGFDYVEFISHYNSCGWYAPTKGYYTKDNEIIRLKEQANKLIDETRKKEYAWNKLDWDSQQASKELTRIKKKWWYKLFKNL